MAIKKVYTKIKVSCIYDIDNGSDIDHCKKCSFFNGLEKDKDNNVTGVDCLRNEIPLIRCHVTSFKMGDYLYKARYYDEDKEDPLNEAYDYCSKCCFNKRLQNGSEICLLRSGVKEHIEYFMCYEGEIWEKYKIEEK